MLSSDLSLGKRKQHHDFAVNRAADEFSIQEHVMFQLAQTFGVTFITVFRSSCSSNCSSSRRRSDKHTRQRLIYKISKMGPHYLPLRYTSQQLDTRSPGKGFTSNGAEKQDITTTKTKTTMTTTFCGVGTFNTFLWIIKSSCSAHHRFGRPASHRPLSR
jgi:hypothetical protein